MILGFKTSFPWGAETNFRNKVLAGYVHRGVAALAMLQPKIHTIREDKGKRWGLGMKIHFCTGARTKQMNIFKVDECKGTQEINIVYPKIFVDNRLLAQGEMLDLSRNDGFESIGDFWKYFDKPFMGRIIHWTEKRY
jgi:hypothetical protein